MEEQVTIWFARQPLIQNQTTGRHRRNFERPHLAAMRGMRGQSLEEFQKKSYGQVLYSVADRGEGKTEWDKELES